MPKLTGSEWQESLKWISFLIILLCLSMTGYSESKHASVGRMGTCLLVTWLVFWEFHWLSKLTLKNPAYWFDRSPRKSCGELKRGPGVWLSSRIIKVLFQGQLPMKVVIVPINYPAIASRTSIQSLSPKTEAFRLEAHSVLSLHCQRQMDKDKM